MLTTDMSEIANKQDEMGQNRTRNEISRMRSFLKISLKHFFMNGKTGTRDIVPNGHE
jgi:hypothetical protein